MEKDPFRWAANAPLLPKKYCIADYYHASSKEHRLIVDARQDYKTDQYTRAKLENKGMVLRLAGVQHPSGSMEYIIPDGVTSLGAFLNSTSADQNRAWKRRYMFNRITEFLSEFTAMGLGLSAEPSASRHNIGQNLLSDPVLLPALPVSIEEMDNHQAHIQNQAFYVQIQQDIIEVAPPDERDFPF